MTAYVLPGPTRKAQKAVRAAGIIATAQSASEVLPEHLLLAILIDPTCDGVSLLRALDIDDFSLGQRLRRGRTFTHVSSPEFEPPTI